MSDINVATAHRMSADRLAASIVAAGSLPAHTAIVDVRDDDHVGGHIKGSINIPSSQLDWRLPELVRTLQDKDIVIFHCALSQQRGPKAATQYLRERQRMLSVSPSGADDQEGQKVYVLDGGFVQWQAKYGPDQQLTEAYAADLWQDY